MRVSKDTVVSLRYRLSTEQGSLIEDSRQPLVYLHGGYANILPKIELAMEGRARGYQTRLLLAATDAFGEHDPALVRTVARSSLPAGTKLGGQLRSADTDAPHPTVYKVSAVEGEQVVLDANHPLAGQAVQFDLTVLDIRPASEEEIAHGHVHGAHGHHH